MRCGCGSFVVEGEINEGGGTASQAGEAGDALDGIAVGGIEVGIGGQHLELGSKSARKRMGSKRIEIAVLRQVCDQIFRFIDDLEITSVELDKVLYWTLPEDVRHDMAKAPMAEHVGDLVDDYDFIVPAATDQEQAVPLLLEHVAPILAALATKLPSSK